LGRLIQEYVGNGSVWGLSVEYVEDGASLIGTGAVLRKAFDESKLDDSFFVLYGDSFLPINFDDVQKFFVENNYSALMTYYKNNNQFDRSNVSRQPDNRIYYEKYAKNLEEWNIAFNYIDYGLSILKKEIIEYYIPTNQYYDLSVLFSELSQYGSRFRAQPWQLFDMK
jgi:NDP-sugar pyrophosphorylase family protein